MKRISLIALVLLAFVAFSGAAVGTAPALAGVTINDDPGDATWDGWWIDPDMFDWIWGSVRGGDGGSADYPIPPVSDEDGFGDGENDAEMVIGAAILCWGGGGACWGL